MHKLDQIIQGDLDDVVNAMVEFDRNERLSGGAAE
jgi:hypothetical protein